VRLKDCSTPGLLAHLPTVQKLLGRLLQCVPEGASAQHPVILVRGVWCAACGGGRACCRVEGPVRPAKGYLTRQHLNCGQRALPALRLHTRTHTHTHTRTHAHHALTHTHARHALTHPLCTRACPRAPRADVCLVGAEGEPRRVQGGERGRHEPGRQVF
jgi:hypothetical protein